MLALGFLGTPLYFVILVRKSIFIASLFLEVNHGQAMPRAGCRVFCFQTQSGLTFVRSILALLAASSSYTRHDKICLAVSPSLGVKPDFAWNVKAEADLCKADVMDWRVQSAQSWDYKEGSPKCWRKIKRAPCFSIKDISLTASQNFHPCGPTLLKGHRLSSRSQTPFWRALKIWPRNRWSPVTWL